MKYLFPMSMISMIFIILLISIYTTYHRNTKREYFIYNIGKDNNNNNKKNINKHDSNKDNRNISEGTLSYHKRLFTKYIHRPSKLKIRNITNNIKNHLLSFKRKYL